MSASDAAGNGVPSLPPLEAGVLGVDCCVGDAQRGPPSLDLPSGALTEATLTVASFVTKPPGAPASKAGKDIVADCVGNEEQIGALSETATEASDDDISCRSEKSVIDDDLGVNSHVEIVGVPLCRVCV